MRGIFDNGWSYKPNLIVSQTLVKQWERNWNFGEGCGSRDGLADGLQKIVSRMATRTIALGACTRHPFSLSGATMTESVQNQFHAAGDAQFVEDTE